MKGGFILGLESTVNRMVRILKEEMYLQKEISIDKILQSIENVKEDEVIYLAREFFNKDQFTVSIVSPE